MAMGHGQSCWWGLDLVDISPKVVLADWGIPQLLPPCPVVPCFGGQVGPPWLASHGPWRARGSLAKITNVGVHPICPGWSRI